MIGKSQRIGWSRAGGLGGRRGGGIGRGGLGIARTGSGGVGGSQGVGHEIGRAGRVRVCPEEEVGGGARGTSAVAGDGSARGRVVRHPDDTGRAIPLAAAPASHGHHPAPDRRGQATTGRTREDGRGEVESDPHHRDDLGGISYEPGVGRLLRGAGLARGRTAEARGSDGGARPTVDDILEHVVQNVRHLRLDPALTLRSSVRSPEGHTAGRLHPSDEAWFHAPPEPCQRRVGDGELHGR
jgi:hypothetical protein